LNRFIKRNIVSAFFGRPFPHGLSLAHRREGKTISPALSCRTHTNGKPVICDWTNKNEELGQ